MFLVPSGCREMRQQLRRQHLCFKVSILQTDSPKPFRTIVGMEHAWHRQLTVYKSQEPARPRQTVFWRKLRQKLGVHLVRVCRHHWTGLQQQSDHSRSNRCLIGASGILHFPMVRGELNTRWVRKLMWLCLETCTINLCFKLSSVILETYILRLIFWDLSICIIYIHIYYTNIWH